MLVASVYLTDGSKYIAIMIDYFINHNLFIALWLGSNPIQVLAIQTISVDSEYILNMLCRKIR